MRPDATLSPDGRQIDQLKLPAVEGMDTGALAEAYPETMRWDRADMVAYLRCDRCSQCIGTQYQTALNGERWATLAGLHLLLEHKRAHEVRDAEAGR